MSTAAPEAQPKDKLITLKFADQTGSKSVEARVNPDTAVKSIIPAVITKMGLPVTGPDGQAMSYSLDHKEGGQRLQEDKNLTEQNVQDGHNLILYPEIVAG